MQNYITTIEEKRHNFYYSYYNKQNNSVICIKLAHAITVNYLKFKFKSIHIIILFFNPSPEQSETQHIHGLPNFANKILTYQGP